MSEHTSWIADAHVDVLYRMDAKVATFTAPLRYRPVLND